MHLTGERLVEVRSALNVLKERRLPTLDADLAVARIYGDLRPALKEYDAVVKTIQRDLDAAKKAKDEDGQAELMRKYDELLERKFEVPEPRATITREMLPKALKGDQGEMNAAGVAGIIIALGEPFFVLDED